MEQNTNSSEGNEQGDHPYALNSANVQVFGGIVVIANLNFQFLRFSYLIIFSNKF